MTKVRIRRVAARTRWQLITFCGKSGGESRGVVDVLAVRKDHRKPSPGTKRGDALQMMLIQVKGGGAPMPSEQDGKRLRIVAKRNGASRILLASWKRGTEARFFELHPSKSQWVEVSDLEAVFR